MIYLTFPDISLTQTVYRSTTLLKRILGNVVLLCTQETEQKTTHSVLAQIIYTPCCSFLFMYLFLF